MYVDLIVPTRNRLRKLERMLRTVPAEAAGTRINVRVACDGDAETFAALQVRGGCEAVLVPERRGAVYCRNMLIRSSGDAVLYATDDVEFLPYSIDVAVRAMLSRFPDDDGVVGFHQVGNRYNPAGVALVGRAFVDRYPGRDLFNPAYSHFACQEVHTAAVKLGRFRLERGAMVRHWHPDFNRGEMDRTHAEARTWRARDLALSAERERLGLVWGING